MILFNETFGIDPEIEIEWLHWMRHTHIPAIMQTGLFVEFKIFKVLGGEEQGSVSYSVQFFATTIDQVVEYLHVAGPPLIEELRQRYANKHVAFRTLLQEI
jgi:hypothetical protein